ncbi:hypothetical protein LMG8286_00069 [Campylobacter suis]|uniref:Cation/H+ exchanger transmembrane domain-containing protein n=1 Tax=Campylobacter suis TaxID=2790657 RepID=A0ABM8Q0C6_9BACT|nr:hypothetical protein LMG8286_00069 [Campylobacter suis]
MYNKSKFNTGRNLQENGLYILLTLAAIIFASPYISKNFRIPIAPVEIMLGTIAGYLGLLSHNELFDAISEAGFFFLMFLAGMEVDLRIFLNADRKVLKLGCIYIALLYVIATFCMFVFKLDPLFIIIIPIMAVGMIFTLFKEYGKDQQWLNLSMLIGVIGEVVSITLLTITSAYLQFGGSWDFWLSIIYLLGFLLLSGVLFKFLGIIFWWFPGFKTVLMPQYDKNEKDIRLSIAVFLAVCALMVFLRLEVAFGAFIAGMIIATFFDHKQDLPHKLGSFGFGFLVPIFFAHIGSTLKVETLFVGEVVKEAIFITVTMIVCRLVASIVFINILKIKQIVIYALSHSMPLTLLIAVATIAHKSGSLSDEFYSSFVLASLLQVLFCMVTIKILVNFKSKKA